MTGQLAGRVALVTGAAQGIGLAIASRFAAEGARVVIADLNDAAAEAAVAQLVESRGPDCATAVHTDVTDEHSVAAAVESTVARFGGLDVLVNNASVIRWVTIRRMTLEDWSAVLDVHLRGTWLMMKHAREPLEACGNGSIVNISSIVGKIGEVGQAHYAAAKAGVVGLTKAAAKEFAPAGIRVNAIRPGLIDTPASLQMPDKTRASRVDETPLKRAGTAAELANAALFYASAESSFVTGTVLDVTGGRHM
jgi:3-oxoacyl-[acyl-carrier protein] reductase